ncbi:MAG: FixH family protein [Rhodospirillales bacterium]|nr:FixH family protein [Rhodospirillales bacterium]
MNRLTRKTGWWYPWALFGVMVVTMIVNGILVWIADDTFSGLATGRYGDLGVDYNRALEGRAAQERLGWRADIAFEPRGGGGVIEVRLATREGDPVEGADAELLIRRPVEDGFDRRIGLIPEGNGRYTARVALPKPGQWALHLLVRRGDVVFQHQTRIMAP